MTEFVGYLFVGALWGIAIVIVVSLYMDSRR